MSEPRHRILDIGAASEQAEPHPRPQLIRPRHVMLDVAAGFAFDDDDMGLSSGFPDGDPRHFTRTIRLPFAPESSASGIGDTGFHPVVWYRIEFSDAEIAAAGLGQQGERLLLHFGAVDHIADVWVDGRHVAHHVGGQTPFAADVTDVLDKDREAHVVVVRAEDDPHDARVPRGKQDWRRAPHDIWYHRTTGIWQPVWLEAAPSPRIASVHWRPAHDLASVRLEVELVAPAGSRHRLDLAIRHRGRPVADVRAQFSGRSVAVDVPLDPHAKPEQETDIWWRPERPELLDALFRLETPDGHRVDEVGSYLGLRTVDIAHGRLLLNHRPLHLRAVLEQGFWPDSHLSAPNPAALREEVELVKSLGFNAARIHQKVEDPRFLYWADRLGLLLWGETASALAFDAIAVGHLTREWLEVLERDRSHPSIVCWVPFNESWGIARVATDQRQRDFSLTLTHLTRSIDPTRPVISNDGWEHTDSDIWTIHDYEPSGRVLAERYGSRASIEEMLAGMGPAGRVMSADPGRMPLERPVMLTEFGGVSFAADDAPPDSWGYSAAHDADDFRRRLRGILEAVHGSHHLAGFCYTQLTDTLQETNGLCDSRRRPKLPAAEIAALVNPPEQRP